MRSSRSRRIEASSVGVSWVVVVPEVGALSVVVVSEAFSVVALSGVLVLSGKSELLLDVFSWLLCVEVAELSELVVWEVVS